MQNLDNLETEVLGKLSMLAEGRASEYGKLNLHRSHPQSSPPPGFDEGDLGPMFSLMEFHKALMLRASERGFAARLMAIANAFADLDHSVKRQPTFNSFDSAANTQDRDNAILLHFEGRRPEWPAAYIGCSARHIEKLRRRNGRDAITGRIVIQVAA